MATSPNPGVLVILSTFFLSALVLPLTTSAAQHHSAAHEPGVTNVVLLWNGTATGADSIDQESYAAMAASMGISAMKPEVRALDTLPLDRKTLLVVPQASSRVLSSTQAQRIMKLVKRGLRLITGGESALLSELGVKFGEPLQVSVVIDSQIPDNHLHWADRPVVRWLAGLPSAGVRILYTDSATGHPLAASGSLEEGRYIILAPQFDPVSGNGYSRFPTMVNAIAQWLDCRPAFRRQGVDAYYDPGYHLFTPADSLARLWKSWGIRAIHTAAWYYDRTPPYDYHTLIDAAHRNGILVYLWLEWPHVGRELWERHPEWREKNALLQDAKLDWLHLMDLQNPDCMHAALEDLSRELALDWDGVDIAEFTITGAGGQALAGPSRPEWFTSFGAPMRSEFKAVAGFDPLELVNPQSEHFWQRDSTGLQKFYDFRKVVNNRLLRQVVVFILDLERKKKRDWELIHTIVDNSLHPEFDRMFGFDLDATLKLVKEWNLTLNVEDPYLDWDDPPIRYRHLRATLLERLPGRSSMIDINVVPVHPPSLVGFASSQPTGVEFLEQLQMASEGNGRVCVYSESSVFPQDWSLVPYAMASGSAATRRSDGWEVSVPATAVFEAGNDGTVMLDGKPWPCSGPDGTILPAGTRRIKFGKTSLGARVVPPGLRVTAISEELRSAAVVSGGFELTYASPSRCLVTVSASPKKVLVDGSEVRVPVLRSNKSWVIVAPSGVHRLRVLGKYGDPSDEKLKSPSK